MEKLEAARKKIADREGIRYLDANACAVCETLLEHKATDKQPPGWYFSPCLRASSIRPD